jgi:hypothetical protein
LSVVAIRGQLRDSYGWHTLFRLAFIRLIVYNSLVMTSQFYSLDGHPGRFTLSGRRREAEMQPPP